MACMLFIQSPQKHSQRTFTGIYRKNSTDYLSEPDDEMETGSINDNSGMLIILPLELISILF